MEKLINQLLGISTNDLLASKTLYEKGLHAQSYFSFQQAVEKANKAVGLYGELINEKEMRQIQHDQMKIYKKGLKKKEEEVTSILEIKEQHPKIFNHAAIKDLNLTDYCEAILGGAHLIDSLKQQDLINISEEDLNSIIIQLHEIETVELDFPESLDEETKGKIKNLAGWAGTFKTEEAENAKKMYEDILTDPEHRKIFIDVTREMLRMTMEKTFMCQTFYYCALITIQHSSLTRYPEIGSGNLNPLDVYKPELPIIKKQPEFMMLFEKALGILKQYVEISKSVPTTG